MSLFRVGIVGWGDIARIHALNIEQAGAKVSAVVSGRKRISCGYPVYTSVEDMLPHVDAVTITTPNFLHAESCLKTVRAGKAVLVEKPLCTSQEELDAIDTVVSKKKIPMHVGYRLRWNPVAMRLRQRICRVRKICCMYQLSMDILDSGKDWTRSLEKSGGAFFTLGIHSLDLARWLAGGRGEAFTSLHARAEGRKNKCDFPLKVALSGKLPSGIEIIAGADMSDNTPYSFKIQIENDDGTLTDTFLPAPNEKNGGTEYISLLENFIRAAEHGIWDEGEHNEIIQTYRELLKARKIAEYSTANSAMLKKDSLEDCWKNG